MHHRWVRLLAAGRSLLEDQRSAFAGNGAPRLPGYCGRSSVDPVRVHQSLEVHRAASIATASPHLPWTHLLWLVRVSPALALPRVADDYPIRSAPFLPDS